MKSIIASTVAILAFTSSTFANAIPRAAGTATITLTNEFSGRNAGAQVPVDGTEHSFLTLYGATGLNENGAIKASSVALNGAQPNGVTPSGPRCTIKNGSGQPLVTFGDSRTYYRFGSDPNKLEVVDVTYYSVSCCY